MTMRPMFWRVYDHAPHGCCAAVQATVTEEERCVKIESDRKAGIKFDENGNELKVSTQYAATAAPCRRNRLYLGSICNQSILLSLPGQTHKIAFPIAGVSTM